MRSNIRTFLISSILVFMMVCLQHLLAGFWNRPLSSPVTAQSQVMLNILPKLQQQTNNYQLKKQTSLLPQAYAAGDYDQAKAYVVVDYDTGDILASKNEDASISIASLTKIMTAVTVLDLASPDEKFTVSQDAPHMIPTRLALTPGEQFSVEELLNGSLLTSANDCTQVIMEGVDAKYQQPVFIQAMNAKAQFLGLTETHFVNPQGFDDPNHKSSAHDLAILAHYALEHYPTIRNIVQKDHEVLAASPLHTESYLNNWNGLIGVYPGAFGVKIGNTDDAGYTTVVAAERDGHRVLVVTLGAPGVLERDMWTAQLLDLGFNRLAHLAPVNVTEQQLRAKYKTWKYFN